jgi:uncharacterized membrane protein YfhO
VLPPGHEGELHRVFSDATTQIDELKHSQKLFSSIGNKCTVTPTGETDATVTCPRPSRVLYRELYMPGWHAQANGQPVPVQANGPLFQSVAVGSGTTVLSFGYTPPHADLALVACLAGLALLVLASPRVSRRFRKLRVSGFPSDPSHESTQRVHEVDMASERNTLHG